MANALAITHCKFSPHCFQGSISSLLIPDPKLSGRHSVFERCLWSSVSSNSTIAGSPAQQVNWKWRAPGRNLNLRHQGHMGMGVKAEAVEVGGYGGTGEGGSGGGGPHGNGNGGEGGYDGKMNNSDNGCFLSWYLMLLEKYPVTTKAVTSALLTFFGDLFCQLVIDKSPKLDVKRLSMFTLLGLVLVGPTLHFWYLSLSKLISGSGAYSAGLRLLLDQFLFSPLFIGVFFASLLTLEGRPSEILPKLQQDWFASVLANWKLWIPFQFVNFLVVPQQLQVLVANVIALAWNVYLSFASHKNVVPTESSGS